MNFQSQLGSIGALQQAQGHLAQVILSIPAWFDWRLIKERKEQ